LAGTLILFGVESQAVPPTGTVYRTLEVDANGVLVNAGTNLAAANGIATTAQVAAIEATANSALQTESDTLATVMSRGNETGTNQLIITATSKNLSISSTGSSEDNDTDTNRLTIAPYGYTSPNAERGASLSLRGNEWGTTSGGDLDLWAGNTTSDLSGKIQLKTQGGYVYMLKTGTWDFRGLPISNAVFYGSGANITGITPEQVGAASLGACVLTNNIGRIGVITTDTNTIVVTDGGGGISTPQAWGIYPPNGTNQYGSYMDVNYFDIIIENPPYGVYDGHTIGIPGNWPPMAENPYASGTVHVAYGLVTNWIGNPLGAVTIPSLQINPAQIGAAWHTNTVITAVQTNDTGAVTGIVSQAIIYLGAP
jgi:hypothetical protein